MTSAPIDDAGLRALLDRLAAAELEYDGLHRRLVTFFELKGVVDPPAAADEALNRLARKLVDGVAVDEPLRYALGVARFVALEAQRVGARTAALEGDVPDDRPDDDRAQVERRLSALDGCLDDLHAAESRVVLEYFRDISGRARARHRQALARELGVTEVNLRSRAMRLRVRLKKCVEATLAGATKPASNAHPGESP